MFWRRKKESKFLELQYKAIMDLYNQIEFLEKKYDAAGGVIQKLFKENMKRIAALESKIS